MKATAISTKMKENEVGDTEFSINEKLVEV